MKVELMDTKAIKLETICLECRKYPIGWATDKDRDDHLEYRLSIFHAQKDDTGIFTCTTPVRYSHSVEIIVHPVHCAPIPERKGLILSSKNTKMGSKVKFSCDNGNSLIGTAEVTVQLTIIYVSVMINFWDFSLFILFFFLGDVSPVGQLEFSHSVLRERPVSGYHQLFREDPAHVGSQPRGGRQSHFLLSAGLHHSRIIR